MILESGTKVLLSHRRLFETDHARYFIGVVEGYEDGLARVTGHTWLRDGYTGEYVHKDDERTKIISITSGTVIVYQLPSSLQLGELAMRTEGHQVFLTDGADFCMDMTEAQLHDARVKYN